MRMLSKSLSPSFADDDRDEDEDGSSLIVKSRRSLAVLPPTTAFDTWRHYNSDAGVGICEETHGGKVEVSVCEPWITALLLVGFDIDKGQVVEACVPENVLTHAEQEAICFHAMPDSAAGGTGHEDAIYTFRIRRETSEGLKTDRRLLLAHTRFRQTLDSTNPRGFFQKAVVVVTSAPCMQMPRIFLSLLASLAFQEGPRVLHKAIADIGTWPDPRQQTYTRTLCLPFVGEDIFFNIPESFLSSFAAPDVAINTPFRGTRSVDSPTGIACCTFSHKLGDCDALPESIDDAHADTRTPNLVRESPLCLPLSSNTAPPFHEINLPVALKGVHEKIYSLWELVATGEPILIVAPTPTSASSAVLAIMGLIHPLPFIGEWRPYLCIQDSSYEDLASCDDVKSVAPKGGLYGVTNSIVASTVPFRHVLTLPGVQVGKSQKRGLQTKHRSCLHKSRQLAGLLSSAVSAHRRNEMQSDKLAMQARTCIHDKITRPFLRAFDRYLTPIWGSGCSSNQEPYASDPFGWKLSLRDFHPEKFATLEDSASPAISGAFRSGAVSKQNASKLYRAFVQGPTFSGWWKDARAAAERECVSLHRTDMIEACIRGPVYLKDSEDVLTRVERELRGAPEDDFVLREKLEILQNELTKTKELERLPSLNSVNSQDGILLTTVQCG